MIPQEILWIPLLPLLSALFLLGFSRKLPERLAGGIACAVPFLGFLMGLSALRAVSARGAIAHSYGEWFGAGGFSVDWGFRLDALSTVMVLVVAGVGFLIHVYATGYMHGDAGYARFFGYLNLFVGAMLALVTADSLPVLFLGWEGVGLCSYLLIGFWHEKSENAEAGLKAFLVNKVADAAFLAGLLTIAFSYGTLSVEELRSLATLGPTEEGEPVPPLLTTGLGLLLAGACGKSAQIFLHVWLPDAMAGPTPVSALIHAATMVTAGVYLVARLHFLFLLSPAVMDAMAAIGTATALYAGILALLQSDIKRVLAYSTVSQLGFLFLGLGCGAFSASLWHLVTHAFFKALLFLSAGSVIHALHGEQDIRRMGGGLWRRIPATFALATIGVVSVTVWPLAGFQSKHAILEAAHGMPLLGTVAQGAALLTTLYLARWWVLVFLAPRIEPAEGHAEPHESPVSMLAPMAILGLGALAGGRLGDRSAPLSLRGFLEGAFDAWRPLGESAAAHAGSALPWAGLLLFPAAAAAAAFLYGRRREAAARWERERAPALAVDAIDQACMRGIVRPVREASLLLWAFADFLLIDGIVNLCALATGAAGGAARRIQTGRASTGLWIAIGAACALALWLAWGGAR